MNEKTVGRIAFEAADLQRSIPARFQAVLSHLTQGHLAYSGPDGTLTYQELEQYSRHLAGVLVEKLGAGAPAAQKAVALLLPHEASSLMGVLGVLRAGHFYIPLDPGMKAAYMRQILADCPPQILITTAALLEQVHSLLAADSCLPVLSLEDLPACQQEILPDFEIPSQAWACIQYTSGSTGRPRGVIRTHGQTLFSVKNSSGDTQLEPADRVAYLVSFQYALSTSQLFGALLNGACLYVLSRGDMTSQALYQSLRQHRITILTAPTAVLKELAELADLAEGYAPLTDLHAVTTGGVAVSRREVEQFLRILPENCCLIFRLASTEAGTYARFSLSAGTQWEGEQVPAGYAPEPVQVFILDDQGRPLPPDTPGQICVRSRYLAAGYWNQPEATQARFLPDPQGGDQRLFLTGDRGKMTPDGRLEHLGRMDFMVKIRGHRVELEAVETALLQHSAIRECVVVARPGWDGENRLVAYLVPSPASVLNTSELRTWLAQSQPDYMLPARFEMLASLPRAANGKVDRQALPPPGGARPSLATPQLAPRTELEHRLAEIWAELLDLDEVGIEDNFFELGGDSLLALRLTLEVEQRWQRQIPASYFHTPTIAMLAGVLEAKVSVLASPAIHPLAAPPNPWVRRQERLRHGQIPVAAGLRRLAQKIAMQMPYFQGLRWLKWWCGLPVVQNHLYRRESELFCHLNQALGISPVSSQAQQIFLLGAIMWSAFKENYPLLEQAPENPLPILASHRYRFWRSLASLLQPDHPNGQPPLLTLRGWEYFQQAHAAGHGVILVTYHCATIRLAKILLTHHMQAGPIMTISQKRANWLAKHMKTEAGVAELERLVQPHKLAWSAFQGLEGLHVLRTGGIVMIANESGYTSLQALPRAIGGRVYQLSPGFAELALATEALILPVYSHYEPGGAIRMTFLPPLKPSPDLPAHADRVEDLLDQYAHFVEEAWRSAPESPTWYAINRYLTQPAINGSQ